MCDAAELERRAWIASHAREVDQWRADIERWYAVIRPARLAANIALQDVDPFALDDSLLVAHLRSVIAEFESGVAEHMDLVCVGDVIGRLLVFGAEREIPGCRAAVAPCR